MADLTRLFKNLKSNMVDHPFDECYILIPRKISSLKAKQPKKPPPKRTRNVGKSQAEEHQNEKTPSLPPRKKSLSPPQAPSKSISNMITHYTSSSSPSESLTPTHVAPPPKLRFVITLKLEPQELPPLASSPNDPYVSTMDNWPLGPSKPSPPPCVTQPPPGFLHLPLGFEQLTTT
ncbi:hypothetical protein Tco_0951928 [Tanacetum coccineum]|uniref:Uncharacterized protein n=1 Tax=Tanacetum coccineum TaxID=301880 RepID=A0ABQ5DYD1_9ASTR